MKHPWQIRSPEMSSLFCTALAIGLLQLLSWLGYRVSYPEPIFLMIVAIASFLGGTRMGLACAAVIVLYGVAYFAATNTLLESTRMHFNRLIVLGLTTPVIAMLAGMYKSMAAQQTLETEERLHDMVQGLDAIVWEADAAMKRYTFISSMAGPMLGYPTERWLNEDDFWANHVHPEDRDRVLSFRHNSIAEGVSHNHEYRMIAANGRIIWLRDRVQLVPDANGRVRLLRGVMVDTTERRQSEDALRESVRRFREMLENIHLIAVSTDLKGNVTLCNDFLVGVTGWTHDEIMGKNWFDMFIPEDNREKLRKLFLDNLPEANIPAHYENDIITRTGERRSISWNNGVLRDLHGRVIGIIGLGEDITRRKHLEDQLRQSQKMEAIGRLTGGVAHDFNNLLTAIVGYSELLSLDLPEGHHGKRNVDEIMRAAERATSLTRQLLVFSRKQVLSPTLLDLNAIVANMDKILRRLIGEDVDLLTHVSARPVRIKADASQIEQVIMNLAVNARDAMPKGGTLTIRTDIVTLDAAYARDHWNVMPGRYVLLSVSDTGCGMDEKVLSHIFEPFFTTKEVGKGTGLGLSTVYGIVRQCEGSIDVVSQPDHGTTFKIHLPEVAATEAGTTVVNVQQPLFSGHGSETILVVEDEENVRHLVCEILRTGGYKVFDAANARAALDLESATKETIHIMVTDMIMPGMNGRELAQEMMKRRHDLRVLYMSGYLGDNFAVTDHTLNQSTNLLQKPFTPDVLKRRVRELLDAPLSVAAPAEEGMGTPQAAEKV